MFKSFLWPLIFFRPCLDLILKSKVYGVLHHQKPMFWSCPIWVTPRETEKSCVMKFLKAGNPDIRFNPEFSWVKFTPQFFEDQKRSAEFSTDVFSCCQSWNSELISFPLNFTWLPDRRNFFASVFSAIFHFKKRPRLLKKYFRHSLYWKKLTYPTKMFSKAFL